MTEAINLRDLLDKDTIWMVPCKKLSYNLSFFSICETFIRNEKQRGPLTNICSLMRKSQARWLMIHNSVENEKYFKRKYPAVFEELNTLKKRYKDSKITVRQLTFFSSDIQWNIGGKDKPEKFVADKPETKEKNKILGTCVIIWITRNTKKDKYIDYIFEAVIAPPTKSVGQKRVRILNNYPHVFGQIGIVVAGKDFTIKASYFCQQNGLRSACAHSTLKMTLLHARNESAYQPSTKIINDIVKEVRNSDRFVPAKGLKIKELEAVCSHFNVGVFSMDFTNDQNSDISPYELTYLLVESGIPTIIAFLPRRKEEEIYHLVPVIGHTMNTDEWYPLAIRRYKEMPMHALNTRKHDYLSSAEWASHLIIHDDLLGPYLCISPRTLTRKAMQDGGYAGRACYVFGILPEGLLKKADIKKLPSPVIAQEVGAIYFWNIWDRLLDKVGGVWPLRLKAKFNINNKDRYKEVVLRTQLISKDSYLNHLKKLKDHEGYICKLPKYIERKFESKKFPEIFWMIEFSIPELYCGNRTKIGEILLPIKAAEGNIYEIREQEHFPAPLCFRFLGAIDFFDGKFTDLKFHSHTPLYRRTSTEFEF